MKKLAKVENNIIVDVFIAKEEDVESLIEAIECFEVDSKVQIGFIWDEESERFLPNKPYDSWIFDEDSYFWTAPVPKPEGDYYWNELEQKWLPVISTEEVFAIESPTEGTSEITAETAE